MHLLIKNAVNYVDFDVTNMKAIPDATSITISARGHTSVASKTSMSERHCPLGLGSKAKQIVDKFFYLLPQRICSRHNVRNIAESITYMCWPQYSLNIDSETKYIRGVFTLNSRFFIPEVDEKITEQKGKMIKYLNKI